MATSKALKPYKTFQEQLDQLVARGLVVADQGRALASLERLGYYRLSGYFYPLRRTRPRGQTGREDDFQAGATFELVVELAEFDKQLRLQSLYAIETVEIAVRVAIAYRLGKLDPLAHMNAGLLDGRFCAPRPGRPSRHDEWVHRFDQLCNQSKEDFMEHHRHQYGGQVPIWAAIEVWDFGLLSRFFEGLQSRDQNYVAQLFGLTGPVLESWLKNFNFVRNVCAHHSRLWNRRNPTIPKLPPLAAAREFASLHASQDARSKLFGSLTCLAWMLRRIDPQSRWKHQLSAHLNSCPAHAHLTLAAAGFPTHWQQEPLWAP